MEDRRHQAVSFDHYVRHFTANASGSVEHRVTHEFDAYGNHRLVLDPEGRASSWTDYQMVARLEDHPHVYLGFTGSFGEEVIEGRSLVASHRILTDLPREVIK